MSHLLTIQLWITVWRSSESPSLHQTLLIQIELFINWCLNGSCLAPLRSIVWVEVCFGSPPIKCCYQQRTTLFTPASRLCALQNSPPFVSSAGLCWMREERVCVQPMCVIASEMPVCCSCCTTIKSSCSNLTAVVTTPRLLLMNTVNRTTHSEGSPSLCTRTAFRQSWNYGIDMAYCQRSSLSV